MASSLVSLTCTLYLYSAVTFKKEIAYFAGSVGAIYLKCNLHVTPTEFYQINKLICYQHITSTRFNNKF